ncbi:LCP family protein [Dactylosporangium sp. CA-092794]|uniref:LCP family protein n=1 Tax=Dactylosporangium sp. CA-092794 TaxID=3239929 RepID=UPI003D9386A2
MIDELLRDTFARHEELVPITPPGLHSAIMTGARRRRARRRWAWTGLMSGLLVAAVLLASPLAALPRPDGDPPAAPVLQAPLHLLLVGIDRAAQVRTNALVLLRVEPQAGIAYEVTIPRDLALDLPGLGPQRADGAYLVGGYQVVAAAVTRLTGVPLDGGAVIDIAALESVTRAAGGVDLCVERRTVSHHLARDDDGGVTAAAADRPPVVYQPGCRHFAAPEAVDYLREALGGGDDRALHEYLAGLARAAAEPGQLPVLISAASSALELHLGTGSLSGLTAALRGVDPARSSIIELPSAPSDGGRTPMPDGDGLYAALRTTAVGPWLAAHPQYAR